MTGNVDVAYTGRKAQWYYARVVKGAVASGANANTMQVLCNGVAMTEALSINGLAALNVKDFVQIDNANNTITSGQTLRVTRTKVGGDVACRIVLLGRAVA